MRDNMKHCQHTLSNDYVYKEVVVIGNGPSGMVTSFMLAGNVPYLKEVPEDLPIDEMLRARLSNIPRGQSLYEIDLMELAEGLEGRSQNPIPLLMDILLRPCADLGIQADSLIEWRYDVEKEIDHIVLGRGPPGGAWHTFPPSVRTLSPQQWLCLPPHNTMNMETEVKSSGKENGDWIRRDGDYVGRRESGDSVGGGGSGDSVGEGDSGDFGGRVSAADVAEYCRRYVKVCGLQRYFRCGVIVTSVRVAPRSAPTCTNTSCPLQANYCVSGYDESEGRSVRYVCRRVVLASGGHDRANKLDARLDVHAEHSLGEVERMVRLISERVPPSKSPAVLVVGSGVSGADAVLLARRALMVHHLHRAPADALARLPARYYRDYCTVYEMMCKGTSGNYPNYKSYPHHAIVDVTTECDGSATTDEIRLKRVKLLDLVTNEVQEIKVYLIAVLIGSKPDLFYLQTNFSLNDIQIGDCNKCKETKESRDDSRCSLKNYLKTVFESCKSRYLNYSEINGNDTKCIPVCNRRDSEKCMCNNLVSKIENGYIKTTLEQDCKCEIIPYSDTLGLKIKCKCQQTNPYSNGIGFGLDPKKPVDCKSNPVAIDKSSHEVLNAPKGMYALGPLTSDNFIRFIPGGALAVVAHIHKEHKSIIE